MKPAPQPHVFHDEYPYSCPPPRRQCKAVNCSNDALSLSVFCDDCDGEMLALRPEAYEWHMREFEKA